MNTKPVWRIYRSITILLVAALLLQPGSMLILPGRADWPDGERRAHYERDTAVPRPIGWSSPHRRSRLVRPVFSPKFWKLRSG